MALDATTRKDELVVSGISVLYRGGAFPVAWKVLPAGHSVAWNPHWRGLLRRLEPAVPKTMTVVVLTDRGLWSPRLWLLIRRHGGHPFMRIQKGASFCPAGRSRKPVRELCPEAGCAVVARGIAFAERSRQGRGTLVVFWDLDFKEPGVLLTDLPPDPSLLTVYGLRAWIEGSFRALKSFGGDWERTRRSDPKRGERPLLPLAVALLLTLALGTRAEDAEGRDPATLRAPLPAPKRRRPRTLSLFRRGLARFRVQILKRGLWKLLWLSPEPLPNAPFLPLEKLLFIT